MRTILFFAAISGGTGNRAVVIIGGGIVSSEILFCCFAILAFFSNSCMQEGALPGASGLHFMCIVGVFCFVSVSSTLSMQFGCLHFVINSTAMTQASIDKICMYCVHIVNPLCSE